MEQEEKYSITNDYDRYSKHKKIKWLWHFLVHDTSIKVFNEEISL